MKKASRIIVLVLLAGCGEQTSVQSTAKPATGPVPAASEQTNVLASVDGLPYTQERLKLEIDTALALARIGNPKISQAELKKKEEEVRKNATTKFVNRQVLFKEARRRNIVPTKDELDGLHKGFARMICKDGKTSYEQILAKLPPDMAKELAKDIEGDLVFRKMLKVIDDECAAEVAKLDVERAYTNAQRYVANVDKELGRIFQRATNAWKRITGGEDFEKVGKELAAADQHIKFDGDWGSFELEYFKDDKDFCRRLSSARKGDVLPPMEADNGLMIAKVKDYEKPTFEEGSVHPQYVLGMIFFELPETLEITTKEEFIKDYRLEMGRKFFNERLTKLNEGCKIFKKKESPKKGGMQQWLKQ